jgi:molybdopterin molybdotransferase
MLSVAEAQARVHAAFGPLPAEWVALDDGLGRVLAGDLAARREQPPAAVSAMDGYAVRAADTEPAGRPLLVVGEVPAGGSHPRPLGPGEAVRIFTGGPLPDGADAVAIQENASVDGGEVRFTGAVAPGTFVRPAGLDFARGWVGLRPGRRSTPGRSGSRRRWATSGCPSAAGPGSACCPPATSSAGRASRRGRARS